MIGRRSAIEGPTVAARLAAGMPGSKFGVPRLLSYVGQPVALEYISGEQSAHLTCQAARVHSGPNHGGERQPGLGREPAGGHQAPATGEAMGLLTNGGRQ